jgi:hypothetical protein
VKEIIQEMVNIQLIDSTDSDVVELAETGMNYFLKKESDKKIMRENRDLIGFIIIGYNLDYSFVE